MNEKIRSGTIDPTDLMFGSLDVENLYCSISAKTAGRVITDRYLTTSMKTEGIDYRLCLNYQEFTMFPHKIVDAGIQGILPKKLDKKKAMILSV